MALMLYLTDFSTASKMMNLNNPIQETVRFRSVGSGITFLLSVPKGRDICECGKKSVICYIRAIIFMPSQFLEWWMYCLVDNSVITSHSYKLTFGRPLYYIQTKLLKSSPPQRRFLIFEE